MSEGLLYENQIEMHRYITGLSEQQYCLIIDHITKWIHFFPPLASKQWTDEIAVYWFLEGEKKIKLKGKKRPDCLLDHSWAPCLWDILKSDLLGKFYDCSFVFCHSSLLRTTLTDNPVCLSVCLTNMRVMSCRITQSPCANHVDIIHKINSILIKPRARTHSIFVCLCHIWPLAYPCLSEHH